MLQNLPHLTEEISSTVLYLSSAPDKSTDTSCHSYDSPADIATNSHRIDRTNCDNSLLVFKASNKGRLLAICGLQSTTSSQPSTTTTSNHEWDQSILTEPCIGCNCKKHLLCRTKNGEVHLPSSEHLDRN